MLASGVTSTACVSSSRHLAVKVHEAHAQRGGSRFGLVGNDVDLQRAILDMRRNQDGRIEAARVILQSLPAAVVIDAGPGCNRPAVVQLPEDGAHGFRTAAAEVLRANLDSLRLQHLADVEEAGKVLRLGVVLEQIVVDDRVAFVVLLVRKHHRREDAGAILGLA